MKEIIKTRKSYSSLASSFRAISLSLCLSLGGLSTTVQAQHNGEGQGFIKEHELGFWVSGGVSALGYKSSIGDKSIPFGGAFGLGYSGYFHKNWGFGLGAEIALYQSSIEMNTLAYNYDTKDIDGMDINYRSSISNYQESQRLYNVNIPLVAYYQKDVFDNVHKFYASLGFKLGIPVNGEYKGKNGVLTASGYYPAYNQELTEQEDMGYGVFPIRKQSRDLDFNLSYMATAETGVKWNLSRRLWLYTGVYGDFGFNDIRKDKNLHLVSYNNLEPQDVVVNSVVSSNYIDNKISTPVTDKVFPWAVGVKVKLGITMNKLPKKVSQAELDQREKDVLLNKILNNQNEILDALKSQKPLTEETLRGILDEVMRDYLKEADQRRKSFEEMMLGVDNYNINIAELSKRQMEELDNYAKIMIDNKNASMTIFGHTCDLGSEIYNMTLGQERADRAKDYLVIRGVDPSRINTLSLGMTDPIVPNNSEVNRKQNRRLEIMMTNLNEGCVLENNRYYRVND
ncbi:OmpA family protein [Bacteroidales bacterium OttesenSCG-928-I14]|nr:OmpA family protein [Bacteroidales bacterium OttesenSCG-928-I14]